VFKANVATSDYTLPTPAMGTHSWQIRSRNSAGTTAGAPWSYTTLASPDKPASPYPASSASLATLPTKLDWADAANAASYDVYLNGVLLGNVTTSEWTLTTPPPPKTSQTWRVVAKNAAASTSGDDWTFRVDPIAGDANVDGIVNFADLLIVTRNYGGTTGGWLQGDFDGNGVVNFDDLLILTRNYNSTAPASAPVVMAEAAATPVAEKSTPFATKPLPKPKPVPQPKITPVKRIV